MTPAGPSTDRGFSSDPLLGGSSSSGSYVDPTTGETITNRDGQTIAGDPNADKGTYIGDVDDPNSASSASPSDNSEPTASETTQPDPAPTPDGGLPPDDATGTSSGPAGPRSDFMPADDSVNGGTPRSYSANAASLAAAATSEFHLIALSHTQIV
jgi:hypothetical protein